MSRTTSQGSTISSERPQFDTAGASSPNEGSQSQTSPTSASFTRPPPLRSRTPSHTLLHSAVNAPATSRKSRFADAGTTEGSIGRASISMPPPANKPSNYKPSTSRQLSGNLTMNLLAKDRQISTTASGQDERSSNGNGAKANGQSVVADDVERMPDIQTLPASEPCSPLASETTLKPPVTSASVDSEGNRLSFSSLYSLGSAIYQGTIGVHSAPASAASSNAGSVKSGTFDHPTSVPLSPTRTSLWSDLSAGVTTSMDPVSVIANTQAQHQGSFLPQVLARGLLNACRPSAVKHV